MNEEMLEYFSLLIFKNQLLCMKNEELISFYKDEKVFLEFLDAVALLSQTEPGFFVISPQILEKISLVINDHRFSCEDGVKDYINEVVVYLNGMKNMSSEMADLIFMSYRKFHEEIREAEFTSTEAFLQTLAHDSVLFSALYDDKLENLQNGDLSILSLNYIIRTCPEFFEDDNVKYRALNVLDIENKKSGLFSKRKKVVKSIKKNLYSLQKKEE